MTVREHSLAWRWTDPNHAVLSDHVLAQIHPVEQMEAVRLFQKGLCFVGRNGLIPETFPKIVRQRADILAEVGCCWLRQQQPDISQHVYVSWLCDTAIRTTWEVFINHWNNFCYPASDDVIIWPESENWALFYFHEEEFQFGRKS
jgi:hypothetical protein